jgi:L-fuconate dehydratase
VCEYVDHLHEHFVEPCVTTQARYVTPLRPGYSIEMKPTSLADYEFPAGRMWARNAH